MNDNNKEETGDSGVKIQNDSDEIKESDIVFDCPECGKSLVIDYHGAGLSVPCPDCETILEVPIPEGMELSDLDDGFEDEELAEVIESLGAENETLREELEIAREETKQAVTELEELRIRRRHFEKKQKDMVTLAQLLTRQMTTIENAMAQMQESLKELTDNPSDDTQNLG